jgi:hypothetical protein
MYVRINVDQGTKVWKMCVGRESRDSGHERPILDMAQRPNIRHTAGWHPSVVHEASLYATSTFLLTSLQMPGCYSAIIYSLIGRREPEPCREFQFFVSLICSPTYELIGLNSSGNRRPSPIQILSDDVLLNIFHLYRLADGDDDGIATVFVWHRQSWWYKLAHVCRLWRNIILESPAGLDLHLYCTNGVPVAKMLAHSPPLPLTIYYHGQKITTEDESGILLALSHRDRVRHIRLSLLPNVGKFVAVMDDQFPVLERMHIHSPIEVDLPESFQSPNLRHFRLWATCIPRPIEPPLLITSTARLVTLELLDIPRSAYFPPSYLLTRLSLMTHLKRLSIGFRSPIPNRDVEMQLHKTPADMTTLPNLRWFAFTGVSAYLEGLVSRISAPSLSILRVYLFNQLSFTVPRLLQFMKTSENLTITPVHVNFGVRAVSLHAVPWKWDDAPLELAVRCRPPDWQVSSQAAVQFFHTFSPVLSVVEKASFSHHQSSGWLNIDQSQWLEFLRPFTNVKTIHVQKQDDLVGKLFRSLQSDDGGPPLELLPNLEEVRYFGGLDALDAINAFVDARRVAGHPVNLRVVDHSMFLDGDNRWWNTVGLSINDHISLALTLIPAA